MTVVTAGGTSATSSADEFSYLPMNTATTLVSSQNPATAGQAVKLTATVTPANATGNVTFLDGGVGIGSEPQPLTVTEGGSLGFSQAGPSYVSINASGPLDSLGSNSQLTLSMWVDPTANMNNSGIFYKGPFNGSQGTMSVLLGQVGSDYNLVHFRLNGAVTEAGEVIANSPIPDDHWTLITCTYNGSEEDIYINGVLNASASYSTPVESGNYPVYIGSYYSSAYSFEGDIDEVGIWSQALDSCTIAQLYDDGVGEYGVTSQSPWNQDFVAGYHCDEGSGRAYVYDYSGNNNTGTLHGVSWEAGSLVADTEQASITVPASTLGVGTDSITADYNSGGGNFSGSTSPALNQTINVPVLYWDPQQDPTPTLGTIWSTTAENWNTVQNGGPTTQEGWINGTQAVISGASNTITIADPQIEASSIDFESDDGLTLASDPSDALALGAGGTTISVDSGTVTVSATIANATGLATSPGRLTTTGDGTLVLGGQNSFSGGTTLWAGTISFAQNGLGTGPVTVDPGAGNTASLVWAGMNTTDLSAQGLTLASGTTRFDLQNNQVVFADGSQVAGSGNLLLDDSDSMLGSLTVDGEIDGGVSVADGATLVPGDTSPGILQASSLSLDSASCYAVTVNGATSGSDYSQTQVSGGIDLGGATLALSGSGAAAAPARSC